MSIWILIWLVLSAIILGASVWSTYILYKQKEAWRALAAKHNMTYTRGRLMSPPTLDGFIDKYRVSFFTAERQTTDIRSRRYVTVVEIILPEGIINGAAAGTTEMVAFLETLNLNPMAIDDPKWDTKNRLYARNRDAVRRYLTAERLEHLTQLLSTRNADVLIIFDDTQGVVRLETSDPIIDPSKAEKVILRLIRHAQGLAVTKQERNAIMAEAMSDEEFSPEPAPQPVAAAADEGPDTPPAPDENSSSV